MEVMTSNSILESIRKQAIIFRHWIGLSRQKDLMSLLASVTIFNREETLEYILSHECSISRFGDGEFSIMAGGQNGFQSFDNLLAERLKEVVKSSLPNHIVCIPYVWKDTKNLTLDSRLFAMGYLTRYGRQEIIPFLSKNDTYYDSFMTRFYMSSKDKDRSKIFGKKLKKIWEKKDILIVEGEYTRTGWNNDFLNNAKSVQRILAPSQNAFSVYDEILDTTRQNATGKLVLIALGMTATVLAYDLAKEGFRALDVGHLDVEYSWMNMGVRTKCRIPGKAVNEAGENHPEYIYDEKFESQVIARIGIK